MSIAAIVPVWNGRDLLARLLPTLAAQTAPAAECIVVDNGSRDGAPEVARQAGARVIAMGRNAGFAAAVNRGIAEARSEWIAVLNSDVELAPDYFARLLAACADESRNQSRDREGAVPFADARGSNAWFATGKLLDARRNGRLDGAFDLTCRGGVTWRAGNGQPDGPPWDAPRRIFSPPWTAALFRADIFCKIGPLDARFESYLEDVDFGLRCAARGIGGWYVPAAVAWHRGSASLGRWHPETVRRMARNQLYIVARHLPAGAWWPVLVAQTLWGGVALRHGCGWAWLRGVAEGLRNFSGMRREFGFVPGILERLRANEGLLGEVQPAGPLDVYRRLYFLLTQGGAK